MAHGYGICYICYGMRLWHTAMPCHYDTPLWHTAMARCITGYSGLAHYTPPSAWHLWHSLWMLEKEEIKTQPEASWESVKKNSSTRSRWGGLVV